MLQANADLIPQPFGYPYITEPGGGDVPNQQETSNNQSVPSQDGSILSLPFQLGSPALSQPYTSNQEENTLNMISPVIQYSLFTPSVQSYFIDNPISTDDSTQALAPDTWSNFGLDTQGDMNNQPGTLDYPFVG
jgi:hypothetical protein